MDEPIEQSAPAEESAQGGATRGGDGMTTPYLIVGIDPGVATGFALWDCKKRALTETTTLGIIEAQARVEQLQAEVSQIAAVTDDEVD